ARWSSSRASTTVEEQRGRDLPDKQIVLAGTAAPTSDSGQFPDPEEFNIEREPNRHLACGHGIHFCVGAPLARLEAKIALPMVLEQLKNLQRVEGFPIMVNTGIVFVIRSLPVTFQPK